MVNRARPSSDLLERETKLLKAAVNDRNAKGEAYRKADLKLREAIRGALERGLSATYVSRAVGLTRSRLYQVGRGASGETEDLPAASGG
jgi:hypothetical protein